jgi:hypothetical protein
MKPLAELPGWLQAAGWGILSVTTENHRRLGEQGLITLWSPVRIRAGPLPARKQV